MTSPNERGDALLAEESDLEGQQVVAALARVYGTSAPPHVHASVHQALRQQRAIPVRDSRHRAWWPHWRRRRLAIATAALVGAALLGGGAYAVSSRVDQAFHLAGPRSGTAWIADQHLGQDMHLSQSVCGFTMTVQQAYADANRVLLGYTLAGPPGRHFLYGVRAVIPRLATQNGAALAPEMGAGTAASEDQNSEYFSFNARGVAADTAMLRLHLLVPYVEATEVLSATDPAPVACEAASPASVNPPDGPATRQREVKVGPFAFDLRVPVTPSVRVVTSQETGTSAAGTMVRLERLVITPSETKVYLHSAANGDIVPVLTIGRQQINQSGGAVPPVNGLWSYGFDVPLYDKHGVWTVTVLTDRDVVNGSHRFTGQVTFHVAVP